MSFPALLDNKVDIKKRTKPSSPDSMGGGGAITYVLVYKRVPFCFESLDRKTDQAIIAYDKKTTFPDYFGYCEYLSGIKGGQVVFFGSRRFEIKLVENTKEMGKYMKLSLTELTRNE